MILAEKLRTNIERSEILGDKRKITVSMGVATYPMHGSNIHQLIEKADQALYVAKESGRNRSQVWQTEFSGKVKGTNKLTGIVSGNQVQDYRNVSVIVELVDLIKQESNLDKKIYEFLGRVIESTEAQSGTLFLLRENEIISSFSRKIFEEGWSQSSNYNKNLLRMIIDKKQGTYLIDWDEISEFDSISGMPDWKSIIIAPIIKSNSVKAVLYLSVSTKSKEFKFEDFNFVNVLGQLAVAIL